MNKNIIIIGGGPGGYETALEAAKRGFDVTLFNGGKLGGTCLNEGCIPTKCLCHDSEIVSQLKKADSICIDNLSFNIDYNKILNRKKDVVEKLRNGVETLLKTAKVNVINENAYFKDSKTVIAGEVEYTAENIIIATGSVSNSLPIEGADLKCVMHSTDILSLEYIPAKLTIIGGGVIGMEFASIFHGLGSEVTVIEYMKQILPPFDADIAKRLKQKLSSLGVNIITGASAKKIKQNDAYEIEVTYETKGKESVVISSDLLMAVGRKPSLESLNLDKAGIEYTKKGIVTDDFMRTNIPGVYAIGDVNGKMMLAHVATKQGIRALNAIEGTPDNIRFDLIPAAVFTHPECGMVGKTEEECKADNIEIKIGTSFFRANGKALTMDESDGLCKLIFRKDNDLLIGAHIMGIQSADLAQQCCDMMNKNITLSEIKEVIFGHPTISEVIYEAAKSVK